MRVSNKHILLKDEVKRIYAVGDIHGEFLTFADDLVNSCKVENCAAIVCGDIGLGFYSAERTEEFFTKMETLFAAKNIYVIFFRGNHDDPAWFNFSEDTFCYSFPHVIIAEDFTIVEKDDKVYPYKILLWGGAISIDRTRRSRGYSYWPDEVVKPLPDEFDKDDLEINCVCSHSAPDFCLPVNSGNLEGWFNIDKCLEYDLKEERETLTQGAYKLFRNNKPTLSKWIYGHYHDIYYNNHRMSDEIARFAPVDFIGLDMMRYTKYDVDSFNIDNYNIYNRPHKNHIIELIRF